MIESIITSKTRIKILLKFFLNNKTQSYLRDLEREFGESSNAIRMELNHLVDAGLLKSEFIKNKKIFQANTGHPLYNEINSIIRKTVGIDKIVDRITSQIGDLESAYITGDFAKGRDSQIIDLVLVGQNLDTAYISNLVAKAQELISRKIRYMVLTENQMDDFFNQKPSLLIWKADK